VLQDRYIQEKIDPSSLQPWEYMPEDETRRFSEVAIVQLKISFRVGYTDQGNRYLLFDGVKMDATRTISKFPVTKDGSLIFGRGRKETGRNSSAG